MNVTKRNGTQELFNDKKITKNAKRACKGLADTDPQSVVLNATIKLYDGVKTSEIDASLIKSACGLIEQEPNYRFVAARLLLGTIYKEVFGEGVDSDAFDYQYRQSFVKNLKHLIKIGILKEELKTLDLKKIAQVLKPERDYQFAYIGLQTAKDRYLIKKDGKLLESPQAWLMRVAMGLSLAEKVEERTDWAIKFYDKLSSFDYMTSTPTLFYSGNVRNQLSSCFLSTFEDSIYGIFDGLHQEAQKSKFAGGLGMDFTPFRAGGSYINGTNGYTQGAVYFWKLFNDMLVAVQQGGLRMGAGCGYLETWHADIEDFLQLRKNVGEDRRRTHDMNTANWIPDLFIKQVNSDGDWYLFSPDEVPDLHDLCGEAFERRYNEYVELGKSNKLRNFKHVKAKDLWKQMLSMLFETGHPWITFKDPCNIRYTNQHEGVIHSSNLCTEVTLHTKPTTYEANNDRKIKEYGETAVCNLGSINLANHIDDQGDINYDKLADTIAIGARMLDNVIDINFYPTQEAKKSNKRHRPVGMGSMGWADIFLKRGIAYDSDAAVELSDKLYEFISFHSILASSELARERGKYESYEGSLWSKGIFPIDTYHNLMIYRGNSSPVNIKSSPLDWDGLRRQVQEHGMRNSNTMAIAPTASISYIVGCSPCTEPIFNPIFVYKNMSGDFTIVNEHLVSNLKSRGLWNNQTLNKLKQSDGDVSVLGIPELTDIYKSAFDIDQFKLLEAAAARGKWIDQAMSVNLFNNRTSLKYLSDLYMHAWKLGLKTTYYLRNRAASAIEKASVKEESTQIKACSINDPSCESCQ